MTHAQRTRLSGLRVVDMTEALAGPYCAMYLGDMGADVVKVERPGQGDQTRGWGPPFINGESAYFMSTNRNKRSLTLDVASPEGREILHRLIDRADIFINNLPRMASLQKLGVDPEACLDRNPRLIHVCVTGFGHTGPRAGQPGYDILAQGMSGIMSLTGEPDDPPLRYPVPISDMTVGLYALIGDPRGALRAGAHGTRASHRRCDPGIADGLADESGGQLFCDRCQPATAGQRPPFHHALSDVRNIRWMDHPRGRHRPHLGAAVRRSRRDGGDPRRSALRDEPGAQREPGGGAVAAHERFTQPGAEWLELYARPTCRRADLSAGRGAGRATWSPATSSWSWSTRSRAWFARWASRRTSRPARSAIAWRRRCWASMPGRYWASWGMPRTTSRPGLAWRHLRSVTRRPAQYPPPAPAHYGSQIRCRFRLEMCGACLTVRPPAVQTAGSAGGSSKPANRAARRPTTGIVTPSLHSGQAQRGLPSHEMRYDEIPAKFTCHGAAPQPLKMSLRGWPHPGCEA